MILNKKGDVNWFIVSLIITIVSLVVLVFVFMGFNFSEDSAQIACQESAIARATVPDVLGSKDIIPLSCKTKRICVSLDSKGKCDEGLGSNSYSTYTLTGNEDSQKNQVKMVLAREMAQCWNMLGVGTLQIFKRELSSNTFNGKAVICSRVMFDETVTKKFQKVDRMNSYLLSHKVPGKDISYWDYLRNTNDGETLQMLNGAIVTGEITSMDIFSDSLDLTKQKAIFYLESSVSTIGAVIGATASVAGTALVMGSFGGAGFKGAALLGKIAGKGGTAKVTLGILGFAGYQGAELGDKLIVKLDAPTFSEDQKAVAGVFLTDYTVEGFRSFQDQQISFESIS